MNFAISKAEMLLGLQRIQNVVERKTSIPILVNALLRTKNKALSLAATDLEVGIESLLPATIMESGAITVNARALFDIVRELPETTVHFITKENNRLQITADKSVFNILGLPAEDYPEIPSFSSEEEKQFIRMNGAAVISMLDKTLYAASSDESRYHLNGVFFETFEKEGKKAFRMVATDAHRLALIDNNQALFDENAWGLFQNGVIVPRKGLSELRRILLEGKDDFFVTIRGKMLFIKMENVFLSMRLIEGKYVDYRRIIPECSHTELLVNKDGFLASLKRISLMSTDKSKSVAFSLMPGALQLSSSSLELGEAKEELSVDYEGPGLNISFNSRYLIDVLSTIDGENVLLELRDQQSPGVIRSADAANHTNVVMPRRI